MVGDETYELSGRLLAFLDEGVAPVTPEEARARAATRPSRHLSLRWNPRRNSLVLAGAFALVLVTGVVALVTVSGSAPPSRPTRPPAHLVYVAQLVPEGKATIAQLERDSSVVVRRLHLFDQPGVHATVTSSGIVITTSGDVSQIRSMLTRVLSPGNLFFRPVLCAAPWYVPTRQPYGGRASSSHVLPADCPVANQLKASNLNVNTNSGTPQTTVPPWSELKSYLSTPASSDIASHTVLLPAGTNSGFPSERLLLGPAELSGLDVSSVQLVYESGWIVDLNLDPHGSTAWDVLAHRQFHAYIAVDLDGELISVPLTEPSQATFSSFGGKVQISGGFTHTTANQLAIDLESGPLPVPLRAVISAST
jgi:hypothetical protein